MISTPTFIILTANAITAMLAAALLMLVLWQAPRQRSNQLFALVMLLLAVYCGINGFARFIDDLKVDPAPVFYLAASLYGLFSVAIFFFASEFADVHTPTTRLMRTVGLVVLFMYGLGLWSGHIMTHFRPVSSHNGGYTQDMTLLGLLASATLILYQGTTAVVLYRMTDERGRSLWLAPVLVTVSIISATIIWPLVPIPLNAMFLALAAGLLGRQVLRYELFNPLADLNVQLEDKNAELEEASRLKSQFLANMSHELRTPLNSIIGYSELVVSGAYGALNDTQRDRLEKVIRNGHNLLGLINDVLDLNRIESGRVVLEHQVLSTSELIEGVLTVVEPLAAKKGLTITRQFADAPPIYADETRVRQIVTNIVANAVKFTHEGSITVRAFDKGATVQIEVEDTGIGIDPSQKDAVFEEFQQLDGSSTRRYEGSGLGLAITKRLVEMHGGKIWLDSKPDNGTTFFVTLPAGKGKQTAPAAPKPVEVKAKTVLLIDDSAEALEMLTDILRGAGYQTITAQSGTEGLTRSRQVQPDVITLDIMMPGMDGWQVLRALKDEPTTRQIPVVMISIVDNRPLALSLGAHDALTKPLDSTSLVHILEQAIQQSRTGAPILVVDDAPEDRELVRLSLDQIGYAVECVDGGQAALDWLARHTPSLILLDLMMPGMSGFDVLAHISQDERLADIPVIVITAKDLTPDVEKVLKQSCADLIGKGFGGSDALLRAVRRVLAIEQQAGTPDTAGKTAPE